jgi:hypothetical protein
MAGKKGGERIVKPEVEIYFVHPRYDTRRPLSMLRYLRHKSSLQCSVSTLAVVKQAYFNQRRVVSVVECCQQPRR